MKQIESLVVATRRFIAAARRWWHEHMFLRKERQFVMITALGFAVMTWFVYGSWAELRRQHAQHAYSCAHFVPIQPEDIYRACMMPLEGRPLTFKLELIVHECMVKVGQDARRLNAYCGQHQSS